MKFRLKHSVARMLRSRWFVVVCAIWIQCCSGSSYAFGIYSQSVKVALGYDQMHLDTLAFFKDIGANVGVVSGIIIEHIPSWAVLLIGALQSGFGYLMMWLSVTGKVPPPALWQMCFYMFLAANGQTFFNTATVVTCVQNFPRTRGIVIGLMKGFLGLSGAILTQIYHAIYRDEPTSFLLMLMWLPSAMAVGWMFVVRPVAAPKRSNESTNLYLISAIALVLAGYLMTLIIIQNSIDVSHAGRVITCVICGLILLFPLGVVHKAEREDAKMDEEENTSSSSSSSNKVSLSLTEPLLASSPIVETSSSSTLPVASSVAVVVKDSVQPTEKSRPKREYQSESKGDSSSIPDPEESEEETRVARGKLRKGEDHTFLEAVCKADFWLLFVAMACGMGSGLTAIDNMGQIGASQGYSVQKVGTFISLLCIWNFLGRLGFGTVSEICLHRYKVARPVFLALTQATMSIGHLMIAIAFPGSLYVGSVVIGLCYGAQWSLMPAITSEVFGLMRFGTLFNTIAIASPLGAYYLSVQVAGQIYDYEARRENMASAFDVHSVKRVGIFRWLKSEELLCHGAHCFRLAFIIMAAVSFFGCLVCLVLVARTRKFYSEVVYARLESMRTEEGAQERRGPSAT